MEFEIKNVNKGIAESNKTFYVICQKLKYYIPKIKIRIT